MKSTPVTSMAAPTLRERIAGRERSLERSAADGDGGREKGAARGRAVDPQLAAEGGESVRQADEAAAVGPGASDAIVAYPDLNGAVLDPRRHRGVSGVSVFGDVGQRLGDDEVGRRLDRRGKPAHGHVD